MDIDKSIADIEHTDEPFEALASPDAVADFSDPTEPDREVDLPGATVAGDVFAPTEGTDNTDKAIATSSITMTGEHRETALPQNRSDDTMTFDVDEIPAAIRDLIDSFQADLEEATP